MILPKNNILLITAEFPYGLGEPFLETELPVLSDAFDTIYILPAKISAVDNMRRIPANCIVIPSGTKFSTMCSFAFKVLFDMFVLTKLFFAETYYGKPVSLHPVVLVNLIRSLVRAELTSIRAKNLIREKKIKLIYSYWLNSGVLAGLLDKANVPIVSRVHGYDLFAHRYSPPYVPFQRLLMRKTYKIFAVSQAGADYLNQEYPNFKDKVLLSCLGAKKGKMSHRSTDGVFRIVSCSNLIPIKRVHIIAEGIKRLSFKIKWVHFGDGIEMERIKEIVESFPQNITALLFGQVENKKILEYYENNPVDLFITTSSTEGGVPVSISEAASRGIPVMATTVGGIPEIVTGNGTGIQLFPNVTPNILATEILKCYQNQNELKKCGENMYRIYLSKYNADNNYKHFANILNSIAKGIL